MKYKTKRMLTIGGISLAGSLITGAIIRTLYDSEGLPDADVHDKHYAVTGVVADLLSSLAGLIFLKGSSSIMKQKGILKNYFYNLESDDEEEVLTPVENDSWTKMTGYFKTGGKILGSALAGMAAGTIAKGTYEAVGGPDVDVNLGPIVLDGTVSDMLSTATAITVYNSNHIYQNTFKPLLKRFGVFKEEQNEHRIASENSALKDYSELPQYNLSNN